MVDGFWEDSENNSFDFETDGELSSKDLSPSAGGGKSVNKDGKYHCLLVSYKKEEPKAKDDVKDGECPYTSPAVSLVFEVLAGGPVDKDTHDDQVGLKIYHRLYLWKWDTDGQKFVLRRGKELKFISQVCYGLGMMSAEEYDSGRFRLSFDGIEGRQCVVEVRGEEEERVDKNTGEKRKQMNFRVPYGNVWRPDAEEVANVKKDPEAMAIYLAGGGDDAGATVLF